jgi:wyosine [tRNA(Phe)-imidazoG37] synthetase (radical SAM superfamily)
MIVRAFLFHFHFESFIILPMAQYVFGPVPSRRLGFSLGVDIIPAKYCCFDCIYCQIGKTVNVEMTRKSFIDPYKIIDEITDAVNKAEHIDHITFSGSGEPTLNIDLGTMIEEIKRITDIPISIITNGALLYLDEVRKNLRLADVVLPSLDAVSEDIFRYINRPHSLIEMDTIIRGLKLLRSEYQGKIWLEVMLIKDVNDTREELIKLKEIISQLNVDKVQLNTVTRPPTNVTTGRLTMDDLEKACELLGEPAEIICSFEKSVKKYNEEDWSQKILAILQRRSLTLDDIVKITGIPVNKAEKRLKKLENEGQIKSYFFDDSLFYMKS